LTLAHLTIYFFLSLSPTPYLSTTILVLPETDPKITGGRARYQIGDKVNVNCTSGRSKPAVKLTWFINGDQANSDFVKQYKTLKTGREGLEQTIVGLKFQVHRSHFQNGDMKLKVNNGS
jgi:CD80-like C2-set immunoglobulin domain